MRVAVEPRNTCVTGPCALEPTTNRSPGRHSKDSIVSDHPSPSMIAVPVT